jgi:hypothetical protein
MHAGDPSAREGLIISSSASSERDNEDPEDKEDIGIVQSFGGWSARWLR